MVAFLFLGLLVQFAFGNMVHYSSTTFYLAAAVPWCLGVACGIRTLDSSRDDFVCGTVLGSTVDTVFATVLGFWMNFTQFLRCCGLGA